jgi:hypothetical protein
MGAPSDNPPAPQPRSPAEDKILSARDLQENASEGELDVEPGSDADQAAEVPHVG